MIDKICYIEERELKGLASILQNRGRSLLVEFDGGLQLHAVGL